MRGNIFQGKYLFIQNQGQIFMQICFKANIWGDIFESRYLCSLIWRKHLSRYIWGKHVTGIFQGKYFCSNVSWQIFEQVYLRANIYEDIFEGKYLPGKPFDLVSHPSTKHLDTNIPSLLKTFKLLKIIRIETSLKSQGFFPKKSCHIFRWNKNC